LRQVDDNHRHETEGQKNATKKLTIIVGKVTERECRVETDITLYRSEALSRYVSIHD